MLSSGVAATGPGVAVAVDLLDLGVAEAWGRSVCRGEQCVWTNGTGSGFRNSSSSPSSGIGTCFGVRLKCDELWTVRCDLLLAVIMLPFCTIILGLGLNRGFSLSVLGCLTNTRSPGMRSE